MFDVYAKDESYICGYKYLGNTYDPSKEYSGSDLLFLHNGYFYWMPDASGRLEIWNGSAMEFFAN